MKRLFILLLFNCLLGVIGFAQGSVVLDLSKGDGTKAFVLPRVATTSGIVTPLNGMLVYDISSDCIKSYQAGAWSACLGGGTTSSSMTVNCAASVINGTYNQNVTLNSANTVTVVVVNNTSSTFTVTTSTADVLFGGTAAPGMSVSSVSPATVSPAINGGTSTITYFLSGAPTTVGSFTTTWSKLSLTCAKSGTVGIVDYLRVALNAAGCSSCSAYDAAAANTWLQITAAEYAQINNYVPINISAGSEILMNAGTLGGANGANVCLAGVVTSDYTTLPANNYVVAFSFVTNGSGTNTSSYLKFSTSIASGWSTGGPTFPISGASSGIRYYYIMKTPSAVINSFNASYIILYTGNNLLISAVSSSPGSYSATGDVTSSSSTPTSWPYLPQIQVKATASKKW